MSAANHRLNAGITEGLVDAFRTDPARGIMEIAVIAAVISLILPAGRTAGYQLAGPVSVLLSLIIASEFLRLRGASWQGFGLIRPGNWRKTVVGAILAYIVLTITAGLAGNLIANIFGETPDISTFDNLPSNLSLLVFWLMLSWAIGGFAEEMLFRGFLMNRLAQLLGGAKVSWAVALVLQASIFGLMHSYQGKVGMLSTGVTGLVMGLIYLVAKRNLWIPIIVHGLNDTLGFILVYAGVIPTS